MKIYSLIISTFLNLAGSLIAQNYIWPTNTGHYLSSSFGEYRSGHFHSGIDIKTNYRTGYPVFAIANGYVWRVRTSSTGYGKAVYLKLDDGNLAVFGHLDEFNPFLNAYIKAEQLLQKRYHTDIYFKENEFRVFRGDTIAFTGETGTKHPHLHFEIRDRNNCLINPLNTNLKITDYTIPTIKAIAVVPITAVSRINGLPTVQTFQANYIHKKLFTVSDTIHVSGPIGIEIKTHDTVRGVPNFYNPYGIRLIVDDSLYFHVQYDSFDFAETHLVKIDRDFQLAQWGLGNFNRLWFSDYSKNLRFYSQSPGNGIINLEQGHHAIVIEVYDRYMNTSTVTFSVISTSPFEPILNHVDISDNSITIVFDADITDSISVRAQLVSQEGVFQNIVSVDSVFNDSTNLFVRIVEPLPVPGAILNLVLSSAEGDRSYPFFFNPTPSVQMNLTPPQITFIHNPNTFLCRASFIRVPECIPGFFVQTLSDFIELPVYASCPATYTSGAIPLSWFDTIIAFEWRYNRSPENILRTPVNFSVVTPNNRINSSSPDKILSVTFFNDSVYDTLVTWINHTSMNGNTTVSIISDLYTIFPLEQPLKSDILLEIQIPPGFENIKNIGLYQLDDNEWNFLGNQIDPERSTLSAYTGKFGSVALINDFNAPTISDIFPGNGGRFRSADISYLSAIVIDDLSGIKDDLSITVLLDDRPIYVEYNAPKDHIRYKVAGSLTAGQHSLKITVTDQANNSTTKSSVFTVY
ncbi:MAG: M23 family metallopeptidase [Candidatus Marinimicrobia bacterium]|nr:M23 family metallopeptidase [Candidatus Neomarinimicrobiota bacterium]